MNGIAMESGGFCADNIIERVEVGGLRYNAKVFRPENCEVVIVTQDSVRRMKNLEGNLLNPCRKTLFGGKTDPNKYILFFMDTAFHDAGWGGNVQYVNEWADGVRERVNIRAMFSFKISRGDRVLPLLSETQKCYSRRYLVDKLRAKIDSVIKSCIYRSLTEQGFIDTQRKILESSAQIQEKLNQDVLSAFGIVMADLNMILEEDVDHAAQHSKGERAAAVEKDKENGEKE